MKLWPGGTNPALSRRLRFALLISLFAVLILATIAAGVSAYLQSSDSQDDMLLSIARLVNTHQISALENLDELDDDDSAIYVWRLSEQKTRGPRFKKNLKPGFHTIHADDDDFWRVYVTRARADNSLVAIAQPLETSTEIAFNSAKNTAMPLLFLFLLTPLLVTLIVKHSFKPLNTIADDLDNSNDLQLHLPDKNEIPSEIMPFVESIDDLLDKNAAYNQRQQRFIADAAHELRTPITALSLEIENLANAPDTATRQQRQSGLSASVHRLQRLVNQLLDLARAQSISNGKGEPVSLNDIVRTQVADIYSIAETKNIELSVENNEQVSVLDQNSQLQHIIRNALSNAIKFAPQDGEITIDITHENGMAHFTVTDNGPGVSEADLPKLRQPFFRPDEQASGAGSGLGLAICHEIAARLGGTLSLNNQSEGGFRFRYSQPTAPIQDSRLD